MSEIRISGIKEESIVDGKGLRYVVFAQGCRHNCPGCFNPSTHDFNAGYSIKVDEIIADIKDNPLLSGVTCSGGDPLEQPEAFYQLCKSVKDLGKDVWLYTGYTYDEILKKSEYNDAISKLIKYVDVLVDGKFKEDQKSLMLSFRGSKNQRLIDLKSSLKNGNLIELQGL